MKALACSSTAKVRMHTDREVIDGLVFRILVTWKSVLFKAEPGP